MLKIMSDFPYVETMFGLMAVYGAYKILSSKSKTTRQSIETTTSTSSEITYRKNKSLEARLESEPLKNGTHDDFAVLISGMTEERHEENINLAYNTLIGSGYKPENIYILDDDGRSDRNYPVDASAEKSTIKLLFDHLKKRVDNKDSLFVYVTNHGEKEDDQSSILLYGEDVYEKDFEKYLTGIEAKIGILVFDQCYSGGFAKRLGKGKYVAIAACQPDESSKENTFPQAFFKAFKDTIADINKDGRLSVEEAFIYAASHDRNATHGNQKPMLISELNPKKIILGLFE
jgi:hypothetical protein